MSFSEKAPISIQNKLDLFGREPGRFALRAIMAGVLLGIMTAFAAATATLTESYAPGWGKYPFAMIFAVTLYMMVVLQSELATGNMMFMTYGLVHKMTKIPRALLVILFVTFFNLVGAIIVSWLISMTTTGQNAETTMPFLSSLWEAKLAKPSLTLFFEAILANMVVNVGFILTAQAGKDHSAKIWAVAIIIPAFAAMGYEHSIANFVLTTLNGFMFDPSSIEGFTVGNVLRNWTIVWLGNLVGGGLIMGGIYGWLNRTRTNYRD
ncbi:formate/nitrite transporter family protein [Corynebacterium sp. p3-SID1194]|uniref:formate/nitrite transporter family protein n=1 Tax=Corynebacterium sp. p3-SID1194 TaxID=2916105 RepID=UPI0021A77AE9|nr:formate/nitrite transporter family protein [Corynebacterium sp. p3-SID1194]MCT1449521.1 formate/nitrite transporter family protein [Corynebacterium sp. p3-SID1194]